jgi:hypothetical protein
MALGLALTGLIVIGPMQLFFPEMAASQFGPWVWFFLLSFYALGISLWMLVSRPRLVVYNISGEQLRAIVAEQALALDPDAHWAGRNLSLPRLGLEVRLEPFASMRSASLVSTHENDNSTAWHRFEIALRAALATCEVKPNPRAASLLAAGLMMLALMLLQAMLDPQATAEALSDLLRL